jgi:2-iminoacetate synthase ThiH
MDPVYKRQVDDKVSGGEPLLPGDVAILGESDDLSWLGRLAHTRRTARYGDRVTFVIGGEAPAGENPAPGASPAESLKTFALARLQADGGAHVVASLDVHGAPLAQLALNFGADDLVCPADADRDDVLNLIWDAGFQPVERDAEYTVVTEYDPPQPLADRRREPQHIWS